MAITDLTGTKWSWNFENITCEITSETNVTKNINFTSNNTDFTEMSFYGGSYSVIEYGTPVVEVWYSSDVMDYRQNTDYQIFEITGGTDVTDSTLIGWIEANATRVTDLTGTKWSWNFANDLGELHGTSTSTTKNINFTSNNESFTSMVFTTSHGGDINSIDYDNTTVWYSDIDGGEYWSLSQYQIFEITGGTDVTDSTLIGWIETYATQQTSSYNVTATLTNLTATPTIPSTVEPDGSISFTLSANTGYGLPTDITVTGGTKSYDNTTGEVTITDLTGDVTINAEGVAIYTVTGVLTHITATGLPETVRADGTITATLTADTGYTLPLIVYVEGGSVVYGTDGTVTISNITGNVTLTATGVPIEYTITKTLDGVTATIPTKISTGQTKTFTISSKTGYILPDDIIVENASYTYDKTTGTVTISLPTANVIIKIYGKVALTDMARKGGYQLVNFKSISLTAGTGATISGVYNAIANANGKRVIISGLVIGGTQYNDIPVAVTLSSTDYVFNVYGYDFVITTADLVTATVES